MAKPKPSAIPKYTAAEFRALQAGYNDPGSLVVFGRPEGWPAEKDPSPLTLALRRYLRATRV